MSLIPLRCVNSRQALCAAIRCGTHVVDFFNRWHPPPEGRLERLDHLRRVLGSESPLLMVDLDAAPELSVALGIVVMPYLVVFRGGRVVVHCLGTLPSREAVEQLASRVLAGHGELACHFVQGVLHPLPLHSKEKSCPS